MTISETFTTRHSVVSAESWLEARKALLAKEKELTHQHDELARQRRELPWTEVTQNYLFDGPEGQETLSDLFADRTQLAVYHFMFGPEWPEGCPSCSMLADQFDAMLPHLEQRNLTFVAISRAPVERIEAFKRRMGWKFKWLSSFRSSFNFDYNVTFTAEEVARGEAYYNYASAKFPTDEAPGASVFYKDEGDRIFHTYSSYGRGLDSLIAAYGWLDLTPKGRDEDAFVFPMAWVRHHDRYESVAAQESSSGSCCHTEEHCG